MEVANPYSESSQIWPFKNHNFSLFFFLVGFEYKVIGEFMSRKVSRVATVGRIPLLSLSIFGFARRGKGTIRKKQGTQRAILFSYSVFPLPSPPFSFSFDF